MHFIGSIASSAGRSLTENHELVSQNLTQNLLLKSFSNHYLPRSYYSDTSISTRLFGFNYPVRLSLL